MVKSIDTYSRKFLFDSVYPHGVSQQSVILVPGEPYRTLCTHNKNVYTHVHFNHFFMCVNIFPACMSVCYMYSVLTEERNGNQIPWN